MPRAAEVIVEEFINFESEITLLTVTQQNGDTLFCPAIGHRQERGDYVESWQPAQLTSKALQRAKEMAANVTASLTGAGIWGVEFFIKNDDVWFSELSPRPHDTGMVTLAQTQNLNEFELHARAVLGLPIPEIEHLQNGASAVILADKESTHFQFSNLEKALEQNSVDVKLFGKPTTRPYRRMAVALTHGPPGFSTDSLRQTAKKAADMVAITYS